MDEQVKALVVEHYNLGKQQGQNLKDLAKLSRNLPIWEEEYKRKRKNIDATRDRLIQIEEILHNMAGCVD